jgi:hypothetical protein
VALHDRDVDGITRPEGRRGEQVAGAFDVGTLHRQHSVHDAEDCVERGADRIPSVDRNVAVQDLLEHLGIGHEALTVDDRAFEEVPRQVLVRMGAR